MRLNNDIKPCVLVVEDDAVVRIYTERVVTKGGYDVISVSSGEEALSLLAEGGEVDIALMDIIMPGLSGFELLEQLKSKPETASIRVIILTALNQVEDKVRAFSSGAADFISKPFESKELLARLETQVRLKFAEKNLRNSEEMFKSLVSNASEGITVTNLPGTIIYINEASLKILGIEEEQNALGETITQYFTPQSLPAFREACKYVQSQGIVCDQEFQLMHEDGGSVPVEMTLSLIRDSEGKPFRILSIMRDITEHKLVKKAMNRRLEMEKLVSDISTRFSGASSGSQLENITAALETVGKFVEVDRCMYIQIPLDTKCEYAFYYWSPKSSGFHQQGDDTYTLDSFAWASQQLSKNEAVYIPSADDLPPEAGAEKELCQRFSIRALLSIPFFLQDRLSACISVFWESRPHKWVEGDTRLLRLVGEIISSALERQSNLESIRHFTERIEGMHAIDQAIISAKGAQAIAASTLRHLKKLVPFFTAEVELVDLESKETEMLASQVGDDIREGGSRISVGGLLDLPPAVFQGDMHVVHDIHKHRLEYEIEKNLLSLGAQSVIISPLVFYGEFAGVLVLAADQADVYTQEHLLVIHEAANMLALGIKNALLYSEAREMVEREMRLNEVTRIISGTLDIDIILKEVVRLSLELVNASAGSFLMLTSDRQGLTNSFHQNLPANFDFTAIEWDAAVVHHILDEKKPIIINDYMHQPDALDVLVQDGVRHVMCIPTKASGEQIGILVLFRKGNSRKFSKRDLSLIETVGRQAVAAIQNALFYQAERHRVQELEALSDIVADTLAELDLTTLLEAVVVRSVALLDTTGGELGLYDETNQEIKVLVSFGLDKDYKNTRLALGEGIMGHVAKKQIPLIIKDYHKWEGRSPLYEGVGESAVLAVPLIARKKLLGVLALIDSNPKRIFKPSDMHLMNLFGQQAAIAMENALLYQAAQQRAREAETLQQVGALVASKLNLDEAIDAIFEQLGKVIPYDSALVQLVDGDELVTEGCRGFQNLQDVIGARYPVSGNAPFARVLKSDKPVVIENRQKKINFFKPPPYDTVRSWIGVALVFKNRTVGVLLLNSNEEGHFTSEHARLISAYADQVAIAIENARLFEEAERRAVEAETLRKAGATVAAKLQSDAAIDSILQQLELVVPCDSTSVQLVKGDEMVVVGGHGHGKVPSPLGMSFPIKGDTPHAVVYRTHQPLILADVPREFPSFASKEYADIRSWLGAPLIIQDRVIGLVGMGSLKPDYFDEEHIRLVCAFADQVAIALENVRLFEETQRLATTDALTGLFNRRHFFDLSHAELERAYRYRRQLSVMMIDIDRFKRINDQFGHQTGDKVLQIVARRIASTLREIDISGRYGGEEFVVLLPETGLQEASEAAERLRKCISDTPFDTDEVSVNITVSIGVVSLDNSEKVEIEKLFDRADHALYTAKQAGRNRVKIWSDTAAENRQISGV